MSNLRDDSRNDRLRRYGMRYDLESPEEHRNLFCEEQVSYPERLRLCNQT
jgi:hypothetical protein